MGYQSLLISLSTLLTVSLMPPLAWHIKCRNIPAIILILWLLISNIKILVDASIWSSDQFESKWNGKVWCDIMVRIQVGTDSGIVCAITAIALNLLMILLANNWTIAWFSSPIRKLIIEVCICLLTPTFVMATSYIILSRRYFILRYAGCEAIDSNSWVAVVLMTMWPLIWSLIAFALSTLTLLKYFKRRKDVRDILKTTESGLNLRKFARLLVFCILIVLVMLPIMIYTFVSNLQQGLIEFDWSDVHSPLFWNIVSFFDVGVPFDRWITCALSYITFFIFGLGTDAISMYKRGFRRIGLGYAMDSVDRIYEDKKIAAINKLKLKLNLKDDRDSIELQSISIHDKISSYEMGTLSIPRSSSTIEGSSFTKAYDSRKTFSHGANPNGFPSDNYMNEFNGTELSSFAASNLEAEEYYQQYLNDNGSESDNEDFTVGATIKYSIDDKRHNLC